MDKALEVLHELRDTLKHKLTGVEGAIAALVGKAPAKKRGKKMSEATKAKLRKAQKARWAKVRAAR